MKTQTEVLTWLAATLPALHAAAELERDWVWIAGDLSGAGNKALRDTLLSFGFKYKSSGDHRLPSGKLGRWSHSCLKPIPRIFRRKSSGVYARRPGKGVTTREEPATISSDDAAELLGYL